MDYDTFMTQLAAYHEEKGTVLAPPKLLGYHINLYEMFLGSMRQGGFPRVNKNSKWGHIAKAIKIVPAEKPVSLADQEQIKKFYVKWIRGFEGDCIMPSVKKQLIPAGMELPPRKKKSDTLLSSKSPVSTDSKVVYDTSETPHADTEKVRGVSTTSKNEREVSQSTDAPSNVGLDSLQRKQKRKASADASVEDRFQPCTDLWRLSLGIHNRRDAPGEFIFCLNCLYRVSHSPRGIVLAEHPGLLDTVSNLVCEMLSKLEVGIPGTPCTGVLPYNVSPELASAWLCNIVNGQSDLQGGEAQTKQQFESFCESVEMASVDTSPVYPNMFAMHILRLCCAILASILQSMSNRFYLAGKAYAGPLEWPSRVQSSDLGVTSSYAVSPPRLWKDMGSSQTGMPLEGPTLRPLGSMGILSVTEGAVTRHGAMHRRRGMAGSNGVPYTASFPTDASGMGRPVGLNGMAGDTAPPERMGSTKAPPAVTPYCSTTDLYFNTAEGDLTALSQSESFLMRLKAVSTACLGVLACCADYGQQAETLLCHTYGSMVHAAKDQMFESNRQPESTIQEGHRRLLYPKEGFVVAPGPSKGTEGLPKATIHRMEGTPEIRTRTVHPLFYTVSDAGSQLFGTVEAKSGAFPSIACATATHTTLDAAPTALRNPTEGCDKQMDAAPNVRAAVDSAVRGAPTAWYSRPMKPSYRRKKQIATLDSRDKQFRLETVHFDYILPNLYASSSISTSAANCRLKPPKEDLADFSVFPLLSKGANGQKRTHSASFLDAHHGQKKGAEAYASSPCMKDTLMDASVVCRSDSDMDKVLAEIRHSFSKASLAVIEWFNPFVEVAIASVTSLTALIALCPTHSWIPMETISALSTLLTLSRTLSGLRIPRVFQSTLGFQLIQGILELGSQMILFKQHAVNEYIEVFLSVAAAILDFQAVSPEVKVSYPLIKASLSFLHLSCEYALYDTFVLDNTKDAEESNTADCSAETGPCMDTQRCKDVKAYAEMFLTPLVRYLRRNVELAVKIQHSSRLYTAHDALVEKRLSMSESLLFSGVSAQTAACTTVLSHSKRRKLIGKWRFAESLGLIREKVFAEPPVDPDGSVVRRHGSTSSIAFHKASPQTENGIPNGLNGFPPNDASVIPPLLVDIERHLKDSLGVATSVKDPLGLLANPSLAYHSFAFPQPPPVAVPGYSHSPTATLVDRIEHFDCSKYGLGISSMFMGAIEESETPHSSTLLPSHARNSKLYLNFTATAPSNHFHSNLSSFASNGMNKFAREHFTLESVVNATTVKPEMYNRKEWEAKQPQSTMRLPNTSTIDGHNVSATLSPAQTYVLEEDLEDLHSFSKSTRQLRASYYHAVTPPSDVSENDSDDAASAFINWQPTENASDTVSSALTVNGSLLENGANGDDIKMGLDATFGSTGVSSDSHTVLANFTTGDNTQSYEHRDFIERTKRDGYRAAADIAFGSSRHQEKVDIVSRTDNTPSISIIGAQQRHGPVEALSAFFTPLEPLLLGEKETSDSSEAQQQESALSQAPDKHNAVHTSAATDSNQAPFKEELEGHSDEMAEVPVTCKVVVDCILHLVSKRQTIALVEPFLPSLLEIAWLRTTVSQPLWSIVQELLSCGMTRYLNSFFSDIYSNSSESDSSNVFSKFPREAIFVEKIQAANTSLAMKQ